MKKWIFAALLLLGMREGVFCSDYKVVNLSTTKARPLALGGAFVSIEDDLASLDFNPAAFSTNTQAEKITFSVFFNPLGPVLIKENWKSISDLDVPIGWLVRGISLSLGKMHFGILWGEELLFDASRLNRDRFFDGSQYNHQRNSSFGFSLAFAPRVSVGMAGELFIREENNKKVLKLGYRYGVLLKPRKNLNVGLCFFDFPKPYQEDRMIVERLADETLNVGVSYSPWQPFTMAVDVRNVSDEGKGARREPHMGVEVFPFRHLALRLGHYWEEGGKSKTLSFGLGLVDWNLLLPQDRRFSHATFGLNTTFLWERNKTEENRWFFLSCIVRI